MNRDAFPIFSAYPSLIYLDSAATTHKPKCVIDRERQFYESGYATVHRAVYSLCRLATEKYNEARSKVKEFIGAEKESEVIFTRSTTDSLNLVAYSFSKTFLSAGDEIYLTPLEHHSNLIPWQLHAAPLGVKIKMIPVDGQGNLDLEAWEKMLSDKCKMVSLAHISNAIGTIHPIERVIDLAHKHGAKVLIDGAQAVAHLPVDVRSLGCDFYAFSAHKAYGPNGIGVLYGKEELLEEMVPFLGGGDMIEKVALDQSTFQKPPLKFEAGTPMIAQAIALKEALDFIDRTGKKNIYVHEERLTQRALSLLEKIPGIKILGNPKKRGAIVSFIHERLHPLDLATLLDVKGVALRSGHQCAQPAMEHFGISSCARISFGIYNTEEEIDLFASLLHGIINKLGS